MIEETIARLTSKLVFDIQAAPLGKFLSMLKAAEASMARVGKSAEQMQAKLNKAFNVNSKAAIAERAKQSAALQRSLDKEFTLERKHARAKEAVFKAQLMQQKLVSAGTKEQVFLQNAALKSQQLAAVASAKEQQLLQQKLRTKHGEAKLAATLDQARLREAKLQDVLIRRQQRSQQLQRQAVKDATALQRVEQSLVQARQRGIQLAEKHVISKAVTAARESRAAERHEQQSQRFSMQQDRFNAWKTRQATPEGMGLSGFTIGLGAAGAALYALTAAIGYASKRVEQRQEGVVEAQGFNNLFMGISKNQKIGESYREAFIKAQMDNGGSIDIDTAKDFRTLAVNMAAAGKTQAKILETWNTRQQAFAVAGTSREDNKELNKQMGQMASDGTGAASDANIINDRMPMLTPYVVREYMKENGIKDYAKGLAQYNKDLKGGKGVKSVWYESAMRNLVAENQPSLERNRNSVASQQQRADNTAYLQANDINSDQKLASVISDRIAAEQALTDSMRPLNEALASFDIQLTKLVTSMLRLTAGKNGDGTEKTDKDRAQEVGSAGFPEGVAIDPSAMGGGPRPSTGERVKDPISMLYRWLTNTPDYEEGPANEVKVWTQNLLGMQFNKVDTSKFGDPEDETGKLKQFRPYQPYTSADIMEGAAALQRNNNPITPAYIAPGDISNPSADRVAGNIDQSHTEFNIDVTVNAREPDPDGRAIGEEVGKQVDMKVRQLLQETRGGQKEIE